MTIGGWTPSAATRYRPGTTVPDTATESLVAITSDKVVVIATTGDTMKQPRTILVNQDELTKFITSNCVHYFYNFADGECCRRKVNKEICDLHTFADDLNCPPDCPRITVREYGCDKGRCPHVKVVINKIKA